jgi:hypothetical protein
MDTKVNRKLREAGRQPKKAALTEMQPYTQPTVIYSVLSHRPLKGHGWPFLKVPISRFNSNSRHFRSAP